MNGVELLLIIKDCFLMLFWPLTLIPGRAKVVANSQRYG